jgi:kumamolisin
VWNEPSGGATGGGVSEGGLPVPKWQASAGVPPSANPGGKAGRGVPDVAGDADPNTGYQVRVDGQDTVYGGTSAVAPLWAGLLALINQQLAQPAGFLNPVVYQQQTAFHDITSGNNITSDSRYGYSAGGGWDACTGLGSPDGATLLAALTPIIGKVPALVGAGRN